MEAITRFVKILLLSSALYGVVFCGEFCTDDSLNTIYCTDDCCGWDDSYCCSGTWGSGSIAGTVVGIIFFCIFVSLCIACCRRRRARTLVYTGQPTVAVVSSQHTVTNSSYPVGFAQPVYPQQQQQQQQQKPYATQYPPQYNQQMGMPPAYAP